MTIQQQCEAAMRRIQKHINAAAGQHLRAIRKGFAEAGAPVTGAVSAEPQKRLPLVTDCLASSGAMPRRREGGGVVSHLGTTEGLHGAALAAPCRVYEGHASARRIQKHINATAGQHLRAIKKAFSIARGDA